MYVCMYVCMYVYMQWIANHANENCDTFSKGLYICTRPLVSWRCQNPKPLTKQSQVQENGHAFSKFLSIVAL